MSKRNRKTPHEILYAEHPQAFDVDGGQIIHLLAEPADVRSIEEGDERLRRWPTRVGRAPVVEGLCSMGILDPTEVNAALVDEWFEGSWRALRASYCPDCLAELETDDLPPEVLAEIAANRTESLRDRTWRP